MEEYGNLNSHIEEYGSLSCLSFSSSLPPPLILFPYSVQKLANIAVIGLPVLLGGQYK